MSIENGGGWFVLSIIFKKRKFPFCALFLLFEVVYFPIASADEVKSSLSPIEISEKEAVHKSYAHFLEEIRKEALAKHLASSSTVDYALSFSKKQPYPNKTIISHDRNQPEFHWSWKTYRDNVISPMRLKQGCEEWSKNKKTLQKISELYGGVDPHIILGIWGIESHFGDVEGKHNVFAALSTLAFDGRRSEFFRRELLAALEIAGKGDISPSKMTSSYAGAMGQAQFMPTAYMHFATTGHVRGFFHPRYPNIWRNKQDVLNSIANYMQKSGWDHKTRWGEPVKISSYVGEVKTFPGTENYSTAPRHKLSEWENLGVYPVSGNHFLSPDLIGILFQPEGSKGESFMLYPNFRVIMRYNPSEFYALAAALLGDLSDP
ncbi:lytic murein transglycosylase [Acetobacteraceae bacterium]|nr:lytic murein transglycosylase [Acetobacteraceae bacterium]